MRWFWKPDVWCRMAKVDTLGLRRLPGSVLLPTTVAAMVLLAALALCAVHAASALAQRWGTGPAASATLQVPQPGETLRDAAGRPVSRIDRAMAVLAATPGVAKAQLLEPADVARLLQHWLGGGADSVTLPMPAVVAVTLQPGGDIGPLRSRLEEAVPGASLDLHEAWVRQIGLIARSLEISALAALLVVALIAAAVVAIATRAGIAARRDVVEIVHGLGATDGYIARRFAWRAAVLALGGGLIGMLLAAPLMVGLAQVAAPLGIGGVSLSSIQAGGLADLLRGVPVTLWGGVLAMPLAAAAIGFATTWMTVRAWLRSVP